VTSHEVVAELVADLGAEHEELLRALAAIDEPTWHSATPAEGWTIRDQVCHLAFFDEVAATSVADAEKFVRFRDGIADLQSYVDAVGARYAERSGAELLAWWAEENARLRDAALLADPDVRVPWFGPDMSLASKVTARIMETWAHGQDVVDALGVVRPPSGRLKHIARLGVLAFPNSFSSHHLDVPDQPVAVSLISPEGTDTWTWGSADAPNRVEGPAEDFCLVVTQRRHVDDTALVVTGPVAERWMTVAQAFAGPAGSGRKPGQFS